MPNQHGDRNRALTFWFEAFKEIVRPVSRNKLVKRSDRADCN
jgi:hypothetical protein